MAFQEMKISQVVIIVYGAHGHAKEHWLKGKLQYLLIITCFVKSKSKGANLNKSVQLTRGQRFGIG